MVGKYALCDLNTFKFMQIFCGLEHDLQPLQTCFTHFVHLWLFEVEVYIWPLLLNFYWKQKSQFKWLTLKILSCLKIIWLPLISSIFKPSMRMPALITTMEMTDWVYSVVLSNVLLEQPREYFQIALFSDPYENHPPSPSWYWRRMLNIQGGK